MAFIKTPSFLISILVSCTDFREVEVAVLFGDIECAFRSYFLSYSQQSLCRGLLHCLIGPAICPSVCIFISGEDPGTHGGGGGVVSYCTRIR